MTEELPTKSCLTENQSGGLRGIALPDNPDVEYGIHVSEDITAEAERMMSAASVPAPAVTRYYQARAASRARRTKADIFLCLIHTPEGGESGTLSVLNGGRAGFDWFLPLSGNLYRCNDYYNYIAWQAGDWPVNQRSIGIEQGDYAARSGGFGDAHYHRLAKLCAYLAETLDLNIRRTRDKNSFGFISHADVTPGQRTDPGAGFLWDKLMDLTLDYRRGVDPKPGPDPEGKTLYRVKVKNDIPAGKQLGAYEVEAYKDRHVATLKKYGIETTVESVGKAPAR